MKVEFINRRPDNTRLILIFTGWSTDAELYRHVEMQNWDVAVVHDFSQLTLPDDLLEGYYTVYLFAWSLGIYAADRLLDPSRITAAYAINGTTMPVSDSHGIPEAIFNGTADNLSAGNLAKFRRRMMPDSDSYRRIFPRSGTESETEIDHLRDELKTIIRDVAERRADNNSCRPRLQWTRAYLSREDRIFPFNNMAAAWESDRDVEIVARDGAHYHDIYETIRSVIADTATVSRHFSSASESYDTHAIAQNMAAMRLATLLKSHEPKQGGKTLEIGPGSGFFTREYAHILQPEDATFVDIADIPRFGISAEERYHKCDAEIWLAKEGEVYDFILSASAIQWFADIPRFLHECASHLSEDGMLAISTFLPGNMEELDRFRPSPLRYPSAESLRKWLEPDFKEITVTEDEIKVEFQSAREVLMHLKHTGVAGSAPSQRLGLSTLRSLRSLTYRPVYIYARKK